MILLTFFGKTLKMHDRSLQHHEYKFAALSTHKICAEQEISKSENYDEFGFFISD